MDPTCSPTSSSITSNVATSTIINTLCDFVVARYKEEEATSSFFLFPLNFDGEIEHADNHIVNISNPTNTTQKELHIVLNEKATIASQVSAALFKIHTSRISEMRIAKSIVKNQENNATSFSSSSSSAAAVTTTTTTASFSSASPVSLVLKEKENTKNFNPYSVALLSPSTLFPEFSHLMERIPSFFSLAHVSSSEISNKSSSNGFSSTAGKNVSYPVVKSEVTSAIAFAKSLLHSTLLGVFITPSLIYANFATWCLLLSPSASAGGGDVIVSNSSSNNIATPSSTSVVGYVGVESARDGASSSSGGAKTIEQKTSKISLVLFALECSQILCESALVSSNNDNSKSSSTLFSNRLSIQQSLLSLSTTTTTTAKITNVNNNVNPMSYVEELNRVTKAIVQLAVRIQQQVQSALTLAQKNPHYHHHHNNNNKDDQQQTPQKHKRSISSTLSFFSFGGKGNNSAKENSSSSSSNVDDTTGKYQQQQQQPLGFFRGNPITVHDFEDQDSSQILSMLTDSFCRLSFVLEKIQEEHEKFLFNSNNNQNNHPSASSAKTFTDGVNELGFVLNLYCLAPAAKNLVQIQKDTMKIVKMSHLW